MFRDLELRILCVLIFLLNKLFDVYIIDMYEKRKMYCSILEWEVIRYFY